MYKEEVHTATQTANPDSRTVLCADRDPSDKETKQFHLQQHQFSSAQLVSRD